MLSSAPDFRHRAQITEKMDGPCTRDDLRACLRDIARLNRWMRADRPLRNWLDSLHLTSIAQPLRILDVGCGNGDGVRRLERWARDRNIAVDLIGLDINPDALAIAAELTPPTSSMQWIAADVLSYVPPRPIHIVASSLLTHHLADTQVVRFIEWMERHAVLGWFINDLSRAAVPYHFIRIFAGLARLHPFVQYDAPASVARAFVLADWQAMCAAANLNERDVSIQPIKPARLCVSRRKPH